MKIEKEYKYTENIEKVLEKMKTLESYKIIKMKRAVFDVKGKKGWMRLRLESDKTTLTIKEEQDDGFCLEEEVIVSDFDKMLSILEYINSKPRAVQENIRHEAFMDGCQICYDEWPKIKPYVEIEFESDQDLTKVEDYFGLKAESRSTLTVSDMYKMMDVDIKNTSISF